ncbi:uncharacterized protein LOC101847139 [Aplysia californica]|uniref:Uncharacterized protein LOC101847139 n=1 Tax=Aplysia californica TaxID=6500 RepID=A0ABM0K2G8_APLCA|nr:uncharacterized protein LOC101847139 [Aplysia californica]
MTETDQLSRMRGVNQAEESPGRPPGRPMRQLEFHQAMSDFRHMFPETDEEVIEAVLRTNNGMVDATIDQLLTMNIDTEGNEEDEEDDDLPDHVLMSVERDVQLQQQQQMTQSTSRRLSREARATRKLLTSEGKGQSKDSEDCPPSYTEAVQSHLTSHHHRSSAGGGSNSRSRHRTPPSASAAASNGHLSRPALGTMQHLLDLGPDTAPSASLAAVGPPAAPQSAANSAKGHHSGHHHSSHHHHHHNTHHHHVSRSSNHHRRRAEFSESSPHKVRPGRNLLASASGSQHEALPEDMSFKPQRKGSVDSNNFSLDGSGEKSSHRWRSTYRQQSSGGKRPAFRNWNPPMLGTLPDDFLRISPSLSSSGPARYGGKHGPHLHRAMSAVGPERPQFYPLSSSPTSAIGQGSSTVPHSQSTRHRSSTHKPHRSLSFAGHTGQQGLPKRSQTLHPSGLAQHEFSSDILQERFKENERRRRMTSGDLDPDLAQYLEDERLAIMLQNSEFLQELRGDRMFMMTLERDQRSVETEKTKPDPPPAEPEPVSAPFSPDENIDNFIEGYGDDRQDTLEAFPFSQQLPPPVNEDVELRKKLKNMSRASRKQFAALARRFFLKRKKKTAQQILKESQAPSMANLLDEDDENDDVEETTNGYDGADASGVSESYDSSRHN